MKKIVALSFLATIAFTSCKKDTPLNAGDKSDITLEFDNIAGTDDLVLNTSTYTNANNENFTVSTFDYYISNISLKNVNGSIYTVPQDESYFLVKESEEASRLVTLGDIPVGDYNEITFTIGVDSLRSTMDVAQRTGVLDPFTGALGMYWSWNSGYIFVKMEGKSSASTATDNTILYHVGGFGGYNTATINNIKTVTLAFPGTSSAKIRGGKNPEVHLLADVLKILNGSDNIKIADTPTMHGGAGSVKVANNYANMFSVDHVHN